MSEEQGVATDAMDVATDTAPALDAAQQAHAHLGSMLEGLQSGYEHPHHRARLEQIEAHVKMLHGLVDELPQAEANRQEQADRLLEGYRKRSLSNNMPHGDEMLLEQELDRMGAKA